MKAVMGGLQIDGARRLAKKLVPSPGEGPTKETREKGYFKVQLIGICGKKKILGSVVGTSDPGHGETSKMFGESAVCLALNPSVMRKKGGVLTPATAMGLRLMERLKAAGMTFEVKDI